MRSTFQRWLLAGALCVNVPMGAAVGTATEPQSAKDKSTGTSAARALGREIFLREWLPNDPRSHGGDGLGPVFNETSCVSCHNQGGIGGGGAETKNVVVISAARTNFGPVTVMNGSPFEVQAAELAAPQGSPITPHQALQLAVPATASPTAAPATAAPATAAPAAQTIVTVQSVPMPRSGPLDAKAKADLKKQLIEELRSIHPGLVTSRSVVLHKSGTDPKYAEWRDKILGNNAPFAMFGPTEVQFLENAASADENNPANPVADVKLTTLEALTNVFVGMQAALFRELQPPQELLLEKQRSMMSRFPLPFATVGPIGGIAFEAAAPGIVPSANSNPEPGENQGAQNVAVPSDPPGHQMPVVRTLTVTQSERNSIALFGAGLIDSIPSEVIEAVAAKEQPDFPEVSGRVARLKDGRIGRFGWKAQKANLYDFTMTACAVELGLNVPDHPQAGIPNRPEYQPTGFDLNQEECRDLVQFLKDLPAPARSESTNPEIAKELQLGESTFEKIGCAACHVSNLGEVKGIYSDLLVHDLGPELGDSGGYGVFQPLSPGNDADDPLAGLMPEAPRPPFAIDAAPVSPFQLGFGIGPMTNEERIPGKMIGAGRQEWRTAPLWGVRDSAPYLHDGRAGTLEQAIAFHGGEAQFTANRFFRLPAEERVRVLAFLRSLVAPDQSAQASR